MSLSRRISAGAIIVVGVFGIVISFVLSEFWYRHEKSVAARNAAEVAELLMVTATSMAAERGPTNGALGAEAPMPEPRIKALSDARSITNGNFDKAAARAAVLKGAEADKIMASLDEARKQFDAARKTVDGLTVRPLSERNGSEISSTIDRMIAAIPHLSIGLNATESVISQASPSLIPWLTITRTATELRDYAGQVGSVYTAALVGKRQLNPIEIGRHERLNGHIDALWQQINLARAKLGDDADLDGLVAAVRTRYLGEGRKVSNDIVADSIAGRPPTLSTADFASRYVPPMTSIVDFRQAVLNRAYAMIDQQMQSSWHTFLYLAAGLTGLILIVIAIAALFHFSIAKPLSAIADVIVCMSKGDLAAPLGLKKRRDEIGAVGTALDEFRKLSLDRQHEQNRIAKMEADQASERTKARSLLAEEFQAVLNEALQGVIVEASGFATSAAQLEQMAGDVRNNMRNVVASAEGATVNVQEVAVAADQQRTAISEIAQLISQSCELAQQADERAILSSEIISSLSGFASRVGEVVTLIDTIADQTNLLALNATIEAARAGEAGRGFAVVASEVKALAGQTAKATDEITRNISEITCVATNAVHAIGAIKTEVGTIREAIMQIASAVEEQSAATGIIADNADRARTGSRDVEAGAFSVNEVIEETNSAAKAVADASVRLKDRTEAIRLRVSDFVTSVRAA